MALMVAYDKVRSGRLTYEHIQSLDRVKNSDIVPIGNHLFVQFCKGMLPKLGQRES